MPFAYYKRLSRADQLIYRRSDEIRAVWVPGAKDLHGVVGRLQEALLRQDRSAIRLTTQAICDGLVHALEAPPVEARILEVRPHRKNAELHGLYTLTARGRAQIQLWMRTAKLARVVAFRTFLRTLLHEVCHHLDFTHFRLEESFHTEGFFKRESSLFYQLLPAGMPRLAQATLDKQSAPDERLVPIDESLTD